MARTSPRLFHLGPRRGRWTLRRLREGAQPRPARWRSTTGFRPPPTSERNAVIGVDIDDEALTRRGSMLLVSITYTAVTVRSRDRNRRGLAHIQSCQRAERHPAMQAPSNAEQTVAATHRAADRDAGAEQPRPRRFAPEDSSRRPCNPRSAPPGEGDADRRMSRRLAPSDTLQSKALRHP